MEEMKLLTHTKLLNERFRNRKLRGESSVDSAFTREREIMTEDFTGVVRNTRTIDLHTRASFSCAFTCIIRSYKEGQTVCEK